jgi:hypothetical protein
VSRVEVAVAFIIILQQPKMNAILRQTRRDPFQPSRRLPS